MRLTLISNPRSGRGKARKLSDAIASIATTRGHTVNPMTIDSGGAITPGQIADSDRLVIVGGDGTVHHLLGLLRDTQIPFYHCGTGTANLICHAFRMSRRPATLVEHLERDTPPLRVDLPLCNGHPFLIMTSLGMDASVIHRLEESRTLGGYRAYIRPVLREILHPRFAHARVELDAQPALHLSKPGVLVVANMPNYGGHFNPCRHAQWNDAKLDIALIPATTSITAGIRFLALLARLPAATRATASSITITAQSDSPIQIDGEKPTRIPSALIQDAALSFTMSPQSVLAHAPLLTP